MTYLLRMLSLRVLIAFTLVLALSTFDVRAQITIGLDDVAAWYGRTLDLTISNLDTLESTTVVDALIAADGENATYDFREITFESVAEARLTYHPMTPQTIGAGVAHLASADIVMEMETVISEGGETFSTYMWGFSEVRDDSVYQLGVIYEYDFVFEGIEIAGDTMLFDPPSLSEPATYTYGDSWSVPSVAAILGDTQVEVVGYGTLIAPSGQERQALRIERTMGTFGIEMKTIEFVTGAGDGAPGVAASIDVTSIGNDVTVGSVSFTDVTGEAGTSVAGRNGPSESLRLDANYPNPFSGTTTIPFDLAESGDVNLRIFDLLGREVAVVVDAVLPAGRHEMSFDATDLPDATYLYRIETASASQSGVMTVVR